MVLVWSQKFWRCCLHGKRNKILSLENNLFQDLENFLPCHKKLLYCQKLCWQTISQFCFFFRKSHIFICAKSGLYCLLTMKFNFGNFHFPKFSLISVNFRFLIKCKTSFQKIAKSRFFPNYEIFCWQNFLTIK